MNSVTYVPQKVPTMYSVLSAGKDASNPDIYGVVNPFIVTKGQIVEIVLNNLDPALHPFHLHGRYSQSLYASAKLTVVRPPLPSNFSPYIGRRKLSGR